MLEHRYYNILYMYLIFRSYFTYLKKYTLI